MSWTESKINKLKELWEQGIKATEIAERIKGGTTKNSVIAIRNKSYWNYNNLNAKDPVAIGIVSQKELLDAVEKAERRIEREKKKKEKESSNAK